MISIQDYNIDQHYNIDLVLGQDLSVLLKVFIIIGGSSVLDQKITLCSCTCIWLGLVIPIDIAL